jgi:hypothetical protein
MAERHEHLRITRAEPVNPRRTGQGFSPKAPEDPQGHAVRLGNALDETLSKPESEPGFDPRRCLKLQVDGIDSSQLEAIAGMELVSQEGKTLVVLFASEGGLREFKHRLAILARGGQPTRRDLLFAIKGVSTWEPSDRMGTALRIEGPPSAMVFSIDVELWPFERRGPEREKMREAFKAWCARAHAKVVDEVNQDTVVLYRLQLGRAQLDRLLQHRDVRLVDLPPRFQLPESELMTALAEFEPISAPPDTAPRLSVLDSGLASNHPLLAPSVGDAQSFVPKLGPADESGHGTAVAGLALFGDVAACLSQRRFEPHVWLLSGRILDGDNEATGFVENHITRAVEYFVEHYACKVFNLSIGDRRKPYSGGHLRGLAATLDELSRRHGVLFVVSAGNYHGTDEQNAPQWKTGYPGYLLEETARIIDPAPALNALTVGSIARYEQSRAAQRHPTDVSYQPVARADQPSPFSRRGPGPGEAVKPELVAYGGNYAVDLRDANETPAKGLLGEPAPAHDFATNGRLLRDFVGTSFAAPHVAHLAARLVGQYPWATANLVRALIVGHAAVPPAARALGLKDADLRKLVGYGKPRDEQCLYSLERCVSLVAEEKLGEDQHHFFEVPLPEDFLGPSRRARGITIGLAHTPLIRTTRFDCRGSQMSFRLAAGKDINEVSRVFQKAKKEDRADLIPEFRTPSVGSQVRNKGTVQAATYEVAQLDRKSRAKKLFVVVTRQVPAWAQGIAPDEPYALVVILEDRSQHEVRYYQQIVQLQLQLRGRARE